MWTARHAIARVCGPTLIGTRRFATPATATLANVLEVARVRDPHALALVAPEQEVEWSYNDLGVRAGRLAGSLKQMGYGCGDVVATDLPSCVENLVLQLAASHIGVGVLAVKNAEGLASMREALPRVRGAAAVGPSSFLAEASFELPRLSAVSAPGALTLSDIYDSRQGKPAHEKDASAPLGYYNSAKPVTNAEALACGAAAQAHFNMTEKDVVLVSITLNHIFGIGSAVSAALQSGATIVLPDASGVVGCGSPSQRAEATLRYLEQCGCTLFFADTHTLKALPPAPSGNQLEKLRGGVVKIGSGTTFLTESAEYAGVTLATMGKPST